MPRSRCPELDRVTPFAYLELIYDADQSSRSPLNVSAGATSLCCLQGGGDTEDHPVGVDN